MRKFEFTVVASLCLLAPIAVAQENKTDGAAKAAEASMSMPMPRPGAEHGFLRTSEGTWDVTVEGQSMPKMTGVAEMKMSLNGFWLVEEFKGEAMGMQYEGHGTHGYDQASGEYVSTWIDNMSSYLMVTKGSLDPETKVLTMKGDGYDQMGKPVKVRSTLHHVDAETVRYDMFHTGDDGAEQKVMTVTYKKKK
ncbi:MAG: DUF1579 domain-containing protein [Planctomycetota bacterium]